LASGFSVFSGFPAGPFPSQRGFQADSSPDIHYLGAVVYYLTAMDIEGNVFSDWQV